MDIEIPSSPSLHDILPEEPILLMGAGPVPLPKSVSDANGVIINHMGPDMNRVLDGIKQMSRYAFQTKSEHIIGVSGPSSAGMEMAMTNLLWPGRRALVLVNGTFSHRFSEMAEAVGAEVDLLEAEGNNPITPSSVDKALSKNNYDVVTIVQGESSNGIKNIFIPEIGKLVKAHGALYVVDAVCTLSTTELLMDKWGIDLCLTGGQKGLASIPGIALVAFADSAWRVIESRTERMPHWCLDAKKAWNFWGHHNYHYTAPVPGLLATHQALHLIIKETLETRIARHEKASRALQAGIEAMGFELYIDEAFRLLSIVAITVPDGFDDQKMRSIMRDDYGVEIASAFGHKIVRIGQMGEQCSRKNILRTLEAMAEATNQTGRKTDVKKCLDAAISVLES